MGLVKIFPKVVLRFGRPQARAQRVQMFGIIDFQTRKPWHRASERIHSPKLTNVPWKLMVGRCISYWNSPFLGDMLVFQGVFLRPCLNTVTGSRCCRCSSIKILIDQFGLPETYTSDARKPGPKRKGNFVFQPSIFPSWWFQPIWNIWVKMGIFPKFRGENK